MYSEQDIAAAVANGTLSAGAASALRDHVAMRRQQAAASEAYARPERRLRDVFVIMASLQLLLGMSALGGLLASWSRDLQLVLPLMPEWGPSLLLALPAWGLAEVLTRQRHQALPSMVLMLLFVTGVSSVSRQLLPLFYGLIDDGLDASARYRLVECAICTLLVTLAAYAHWYRFRVPLTVAILCASLQGCLLSLLLLWLPQADAWLTEIVLLDGIMVFALALWWDRRDRRRLSRHADVAFWLHLLAAPLLLYPAWNYLAAQTLLWPQLILLLLLYLGAVLLSLCVDHRALMVTALAYVLSVLVDGLKPYPDGFYPLALASLLLGGLLLLLSLFWPVCRAVLLRRLPPAVRDRLPPLTP